MIVGAQNRMNEDLIFQFTLTEPDIILLRIELANQLEKTVGDAECLSVDPMIFVAAVEPKVVQHWYNANRYWDGETKRLPMRVFFCAGGQATCRTVWVMMSPSRAPTAGPIDLDDSSWLLDGPC